MVPKENEEFIQRLNCDDVGEVNKYVRCKIEQGDGFIKFTQPVMIQSFDDKFKTTDKKPSTLAEAGMVLIKCSKGARVGNRRHTYFRREVGKLLHMCRWLRQEIQNSVRDCHSREADHRKHISKQCIAMVSDFLVFVLIGIYRVTFTNRCYGKTS